MTNQNKILEQLDKISFHDVPVEKLSFKTEESTEFIIEFSVYNELKDDYDNLTIKFQDIKEIKTDNLTLTSESDIEIYSFDYEWKEMFKGHLMFLLGFGQPSFEVKMTCQNIELTNT